MSLLLYIEIVIAVVVIIMMFLIFTRDKRKARNKPHLISIVALSLIILNWVVYVFDFYVITSERLGDLVIHINTIPLWIAVSIIGFIVAYKDFNNNRAFAVVNGGLAIINSLIGILAWGIGNM